VSASNGRIVVVEDAITLVYGELLATIPERCDPATPARAARAWSELTAGYAAEPDLTSFDAEGYDEIVAVAGIPFYSLCEHHLLPFHGTAHIAYLPDGRILGLSKFARLVDVYARRLQVQERLTSQIADRLDAELAPQGVAVVLEAEHLCMTMRGVRAAGSVTRTSVMRGVFRSKPEARAEAFDLFRGTR
jgi:GTP cyclohydrolase I